MNPPLTSQRIRLGDTGTVGQETDNRQDSTWDLYSVALITMKLTHGESLCSNGDEILVYALFISAVDLFIQSNHCVNPGKR
jgi:hypothetical protein